MKHTLDAVRTLKPEWPRGVASTIDTPQAQAPVRTVARFVGLVASRVIVAVVLALSGLVSVFLLASGYESLFNRSLPFVHTIEPINIGAFTSVYSLPEAGRSEDRYGIYGKPQTIKLPQRSLRLDVVPPLDNGSGTWLSRASTLHLLTPAQPRKGMIGVALFYCRSSFRTIHKDNIPDDGANILMDTDKLWRYIYRVTNTSIAPEVQEYIMADDESTGRLLISCNDAATKTNVYIEAKLLSVQGVGS